MWTGHWIGLARDRSQDRGRVCYRQAGGVAPQGLSVFTVLAPDPYAPSSVVTSSSRGAGAGVGGLSVPVCPSALPALSPVGRTPVPDLAQNGLDESDMVPAHWAGGGGGKKCRNSSSD